MGWVNNSSLWQCPLRLCVRKIEELKIIREVLKICPKSNVLRFPIFIAMKKSIVTLAFVVVALGSMAMCRKADDTKSETSQNVFKNSEGWYAAGSKPKSYDMGVTSSEHYSGKSSAYIKSIESPIDGFGTYMQTSLPGAFLGKTVKMTGWIKSKDVAESAGMWMRVDGANPRDVLAFDNMHDRPITGTTDWKKYEIGLDVPAEAADFAYGVLLSGTGQVYFDDVSFQILGPASGKTGMKNEMKNQIPPAPTNLDFEQ